MMGRHIRMLLLSGWIAGALLLAPGAAWAAYLKDAGMGTASAFSTFIYAPIKMSYAVLGGVIGSLSYVLSVGNVDVAKKIWVPSLGGSYVITPQMLEGDESIRFFGSSVSATGEESADLTEGAEPAGSTDSVDVEF